MKEYEAVLRLFKGVMVREGDAIIDTPDAKALKQGVFISSGFPENVIDEAIRQYGRNGEEANQTFHKSLFKVATTDLVQLYFEQLIHYCTTYGAEALGVYSAENVFIPKEKLGVPDLLTDTELVVIKPITEAELKERIKNMITINLALSKQTVRDIVSLSDYIDIKEYSNEDNYFSEIKNKEVKSALCGKLGILPKRGDEFLRYFLAKLCNKTLLIKDDETERAISWVEPKDKLDLLERYREQYGFIPLAKVYNRFRPLFLAMKSHPKENIKNYYSDEDIKCMRKLNKYINYIGHMSKKYHKPFIGSDMNSFLKWISSIDASTNEELKAKIRERLEENEGIYTAVRIANFLERTYHTELDYGLYKIRNEKIYIKDNYEKPYVSKFDLSIVRDVIIDYLSSNINGKTVYIPNEIEYKLPQSEKQFVGNIPFGSKITLKKQSLLVGIHWKNLEGDNEEQRVDLDLHLTSKKYNVGWNSGYREEDSLVLFTGDNTNAPLPLGASEFMYIDNKVEDTTFSMKINNYTTEVGPIPYEIIIGVANSKDQIDHNRDFVIDPNNIIIKIPMEIELGKSEQVIGIVDVRGDTVDLIFTDLTTSNRRISNEIEFERKIRAFVKEQSNTQIGLHDILEEAGAVIIDKPTTSVDVPYVLNADLGLISQEEADEREIVYTEDDLFFKKEEVPADYDFSLASLTKDSFIKLLKK